MPTAFPQFAMSRVVAVADLAWKSPLHDCGSHRVKHKRLSRRAVSRWRWTQAQRRRSPSPTVTSSRLPLRRRRTREPEESQQSLLLLLLARQHRTFMHLTQDQKPTVDRSCRSDWVAPKTKSLCVPLPLRAVLRTLYLGNWVNLGHRTLPPTFRGEPMVPLSTRLTC